MKRIALLVLLLLFVGGSLATAEERRAAPNWVDPTSDKVPAEFIVYYFHNEFRCQTCLALESEADIAIRKHFATELESGRLAWRTINMQNPENEHFPAHYSLDGPSLVLVEWGDGEEAQWKNLERIWELIGTPGEYHEYVRSELTAYLNPDTAGDSE